MITTLFLLVIDAFFIAWGVERYKESETQGWKTYNLVMITLWSLFALSNIARLTNIIGG